MGVVAHLEFLINASWVRNGASAERSSILGRSDGTQAAGAVALKPGRTPPKPAADGTGTPGAEAERLTLWREAAAGCGGEGCREPD